jgi:acyl-coenzyme A synthetase/AMP-(fatty) acid ligase
MARYMVPEHVIFVDRLPKTPSEKVAKAELRKLLVAAAAKSARE